MAAFASPWLIVDRYVLRRLLVPRHSPYALFSLTIFFLDPFIQESLGSLGFCFLDDKKIVVFSYPKHKIFFTISHLLSLFGFQGTIFIFSKFLY